MNGYQFSVGPSSSICPRNVYCGRKAVLAFTRDGTVEGKALPERTIAIDPTYSPAWEALAQALMHLYLQPYSEHQGTPAMLQQARAALEKAVAPDPHFSSAHSTLGWVLVWAREHEASFEAFRKAIGLNGRNAAGYRGYLVLRGAASRGDRGFGARGAP